MSLEGLSLICLVGFFKTGLDKGLLRVTQLLLIKF